MPAAMKPKTIRRIALLSAMLLVVFVGWFLWDLRNYVSVITHCIADDLFHIQIALDQTAEVNQGRLADRSGIDPRFDPTRDGFGFICKKSGRPYIWNDRIKGFSLDSPGVVPLVWCPQGSHGRHRGVVVLRSGRLETIDCTDGEFRRMMERLQQPKK